MLLAYIKNHVPKHKIPLTHIYGIIMLYIMESDGMKAKTTFLKKTRNVSFEQVVEGIEAGRNTALQTNPAHSNHFITVVKINDYPCVLPFVKEPDGRWFLKTVYQSRKLKRRI